MKLAVTICCLSLAAVGCQNPPTMDPFSQRAMVPPPGTNSYQPPIQSGNGYYNSPGAPLPGPGQSGAVNQFAPGVAPQLVESSAGNWNASGANVAPTSVNVVASAAVASENTSVVARSASSAVAREPALQVVDAEPAPPEETLQPSEPAQFEPSGPTAALASRPASANESSVLLAQPAATVAPAAAAVSPSAAVRSVAASAIAKPTIAEPVASTANSTSADLNWRSTRQR